MSFIANQDAKEQVRQAIDIVALIGAYLPLRRQGRHYVGLCPWHDDSRPSLQVNPERQSWKCWVCNVGGDIFSFVMQRERVDFREALTLLAERAGVPLEVSAGGGRASDPPGQDKRALFAAMQWAEQLFADYLRDGPEAEGARAYLGERGIDESSVRRFHLGFAPDRWDWLQQQGQSASVAPAMLEAIGLVGKSAASGRYYDRFRGRLIFPIRDALARPVGLGGRILPQLANAKTAKYINSPETRLFSKSDHLYGLDLARDAMARSRRAVVMEGYTDVIMAHQHGLEEAVAVLGTALGPRHLQLLTRYADSIVLLLDGDAAGQRRAMEILELFVAGGVDVRVLTLPEGLDPCDYLRQRGVEALRAELDHAEDALAHAFRVHTRGVDLVADTHRAHQALEQLLGILAKAPRLAGDTQSGAALWRRQLLTRLARAFRLDETALRSRLAELRTAGRRPARGQTDAPPPATVALAPADAELLEILVRHPALVDTALEGISPESLSGDVARRVLGTYRELADQGGSCEFFQVMTALDDPHLKNLLVDLDERAARKEELAQADAAARLCQLIEDFNYSDEGMRCRAQLAALEERRLTEEEELTILNDLLVRQRKRQGIPAPTDG